MSGRYEDELTARKKRPRACDFCRRRKVRCDGSEEDGKPCSHCVEAKRQCTYVLGSDTFRRNNGDPEYVRALETEVARLRRVIQKLQEKVETLEQESRRGTGAVGSMENSSIYTPPSDPLSRSTTLSVEASAITDDDENLLEGFKCMCMGEKHLRFLGRSSSFPLIKVAIDMKKDLIRATGRQPPTVDTYAAVLSNRRPEFWQCFTDLLTPAPPYTNFPDPALMQELLGLYFDRIHPNFPLLHRPTFMQRVASGLHLLDEGFGATLLLVCALSARFSKNPAVLPPGITNWQWAGWQWFEQVHATRRLVPLTTTTVYDLQVAVLFAGYIGSSVVPHSKYAIIGHAIRLAQDLGAHRKMTYDSTPSVENELRKRAWWLLIVMDRGMSSILGRPCGTADDDFDVDYPAECDDEYWITEDLRHAFKQPPGKPSTVAYFNCMIKLEEIHVKALRSLYSLQGSKTIISDPGHAQQLVAELDSDLNQWIDSIPEHLKYDPQQPNDIFARQSVALYASWYSLRVFIHRPFITVQRPLDLPFPSRTICTNAARLCIQVLDRYFIRMGSGLVHQEHQLSLFTCSIVLLLNVWEKKRAGGTADVVQELEYVRKALRMLKASEGRWYSAGRFWDVLNDLLAVVDPAEPADGSLAPHIPCEMPDCLREYMEASISAAATQDRPTPAPTLPTDELQNSATFNGDAPTDNGIWQADGNVHAQQGQTFADAPFEPDPTLEAIFANFLTSSHHDDPFAAASHHAMPEYIQDPYSHPANVGLGGDYVESPGQLMSASPAVWGDGFNVGSRST